MGLVHKHVAQPVPKYVLGGQAPLVRPIPNLESRPESPMERWCLFARVDPVNLSMLAAVTLVLIGGVHISQNPWILIPTVSAYVPAAVVSLYHYSWAIRVYGEEVVNLKQHGFHEEHALRRLHRYCPRQVFYVAATHVGFRNEARQLIERSPRSVKKFWWLPHWF